MKKKNRFSILLEELMTMADVKNYVLAQDLGYDVSYISKWLSGAMIPSEKNSDAILKGISKCLVNSLDVNSRPKFYAEYYLNNDEELEVAIYDNLYAEYAYVKGVQKKGITDADQKMEYIPYIEVKDFVEKMYHPVLRKVKNLDVIAAIDILSIEKEHRLKIALLENNGSSIRGFYPDVHFSMILNLDTEKRDYVYDTIFLINMLANFSHVDFKLYCNKKSYGKMIFTVKDSFSITGMIMNKKACMNVVASEDEEIANAWYRELVPLCNGETLAVRKDTLQNMIDNKQYMYSVIAKEARWLIGHFTESFVPHEIFKEVLEEVSQRESWTFDNEELENIHRGIGEMFSELRLSIMVTDEAFSNFLMSGQLDFYNHEVTLSIGQRIRCMKYLMELLQNGKTDIRLAAKRIVNDFQYNTNPCVYTSEFFSYIRLDKKADNTIYVLNAPEIQTLFKKAFNETWKDKDDMVITDKQEIIRRIGNMIQSAELLEKIDSIRK